MAKFVQLITFVSQKGKFDERNDTDTINRTLAALQESGATVISVIPSIGGKMEVIAAVYVIMYEAPEPIYE